MIQIFITKNNEKFNNFFFLLNTFFSCNSVNNIELEGIYEQHGQDYIYSLDLNSDNNTFLLSKKYYEVKSSCQGTWEISGNIITLKCYEEKFPAQISSGYLNKREFRMLLINRKKIKFDNVILKLKK